MQIEYVPKIEGTPVLPYVIDAYTSLRADGNIEACACPASGDEEAFYIRNNRKTVVAVLSFFKNRVNTITVNMGFVSARYRRRGYYRLLWKRLVEEATERGVKSIIGYHKPNNKAILAVNERLGRHIKYICSEFAVE
jgi:hypothetical protein